MHCCFCAHYDYGFYARESTKSLVNFQECISYALKIIYRLSGRS
jgi:hypothetical protein